MAKQNIFTDIPDQFSEEILESLVETNQFALKRILSRGQATPRGQWYDQERDEWVVLLSGAAGLSFEGSREVMTLRPGDYLHIPAHRKHRVEWTDRQQATVWLALYFAGD
ncbi:MAG: cupin domain-containing protein [bacterium]